MTGWLTAWLTDYDSHSTENSFSEKNFHVPEIKSERNDVKSNERKKNFSIFPIFLQFKYFLFFFYHRLILIEKETAEKSMQQQSICMQVYI